MLHGLRSNVQHRCVTPLYCIPLWNFYYAVDWLYGFLITNLNSGEHRKVILNYRVRLSSALEESPPPDFYREGG